MMSSDRLSLGVMWLIIGIIGVYRALQDEANPNAPVSLFAEPEVQSDKDRAWKLRIGVIYLMIGCGYSLLAIFSHR